MRIIIFVLVILSVSGARAQGLGGMGIDPVRDGFRKMVGVQGISPLDTGLFGERISLYDGSTEFSVVDVELKGNSGFPLRFGRRLAVESQPQPTSLGGGYDGRLGGIGNWQADLPFMTAIYPDHPSERGWGNGVRCENGALPASSIGYFLSFEYWSGVNVYIPGRGKRSLLARDELTPAPTTWAGGAMTTSDRDMFDCIPMRSGLTGRGYRMTSSDGTRYYFDVGVVRGAATLRKVEPRSPQSTINANYMYLPRKSYYLLASRIEDRFGNYIVIDYSANGYPLQMTASDGRLVLLSYASGRLESAAAGGRVWKYGYDANGDLAKVTLPDSSAWSYTYSGNLLPKQGSQEAEGQWEWCQNMDSVIGGASYIVSASHPSGAQAVFRFLRTRHYRNGVHATECMQEGDYLTPTYSMVIPYYYDAMSMRRKAVSGSGMGELVWTYEYGDIGDGFWGVRTEPALYPCTTCTPSKTVSVSNPDGSRRNYKFGIVYMLNDGRLLAEDTLDASGNLLSSQISTYLPDAEAAAQSFHPQHGIVLTASDRSVAWIRPVISKRVVRQGVEHVWSVDKSCVVRGVTTYCFDAMARPTKIVQSSAVVP